MTKRAEAGQKFNLYANHTYRELRLVADEYSLYYSIWCTGDRELYDLESDPEQTVNLLAEVSSVHPSGLAGFQVVGRDHEAVAARLDALVLVLRLQSGRVQTTLEDLTP